MLTDSRDELGRILEALLYSLIVLPFLVWVAFQRWKIWTRLLERQLDKLSREVDDLQKHTQSGPEIVRELGDYIETQYRKTCYAVWRSGAEVTSR